MLIHHAYPVYEWTHDDPLTLDLTTGDELHWSVKGTKGNGQLYAGNHNDICTQTHMSVAAEVMPVAKYAQSDKGIVISESVSIILNVI